jgi:LysM repeat protein
MKKCLVKLCSIVAVAAFVVGLSGMFHEKVSEDVSSIKSRLAKIEDRLSNIEKSSKRVGLLEKDLQKLQQSMDAWERAITARLAPISKKKETSKTKTVTSRKKGKTYVVERGDSLFSISQKYNMTIDGLCRLNKITRKTLLHPGMKLLVN